MNLRDRRLALLFEVVGAVLGVFVFALMVSGCRKKSSLPSPGQTQAEPKASSHPWPCIDRPQSDPGADAAMLQSASRQGILPDIQNLTPQNAALATEAQSAVITLMDFYGDPQAPSIPSMMDFADLADSPHAQKVLGATFAYLDQRDGVAGADVERTMTEPERSYFNAATATLAAIDSTANVGRIEVPLIGAVTTPDSRSYLHLMLGDNERLPWDGCTAMMRFAMLLPIWSAPGFFWAANRFLRCSLHLGW